MTCMYLNKSQTLCTTFSRLVASGIFGILVSKDTNLKPRLKKKLGIILLLNIKAHEININPKHLTGGAWP